MYTSSIPKNRKLSRYSTGDESDSTQHSKTMFSICPVIALGCPETGQCPSAVSLYSDGKNPSIESESHLGLLCPVRTLCRNANFDALFSHRMGE